MVVIFRDESNKSSSIMIVYSDTTVNTSNHLLSVGSKTNCYSNPKHGTALVLAGPGQPNDETTELAPAPPLGERNVPFTTVFSHISV